MTIVSREASTHTDEEKRYSFISAWPWEKSLVGVMYVYSVAILSHTPKNPCTDRSVLPGPVEWTVTSFPEYPSRALFELVFKMMDPYEDNDPFSLS